MKTLERLFALVLLLAGLGLGSVASLVAHSVVYAPAISIIAEGEPKPAPDTPAFHF